MQGRAVFPRRCRLIEFFDVPADVGVGDEPVVSGFYADIVVAARNDLGVKRVREFVQRVADRPGGGQYLTALLPRGHCCARRKSRSFGQIWNVAFNSRVVVFFDGSLVCAR